MSPNEYDLYTKNVKTVTAWLDEIADRATDIPEHRAGVFRDILLSLLFTYVTHGWNQQEVLNHIGRSFDAKPPELEQAKTEEIPF